MQEDSGGLGRFATRCQGPASGSLATSSGSSACLPASASATSSSTPESDPRNELAIAAAYALFGADDPLTVLEAMTLGYDGGRRLSEVEVKVLFPLVAMRLAVSLTSSAIAARYLSCSVGISRNASTFWRSMTFSIIVNIVSNPLFFISKSGDKF